jgi:tetratricopeptide (TPR) repeat protein/predicted  nucleic acid-binding Zn-ribbon protein
MHRLARSGIISASLAVLLFFNNGIAFAQSIIKNLMIERSNNEIVIEASSPIKARIKNYAGDYSRVVIDIDNSELAGSLKNNARLMQDITSDFPALKKITLSEYGSGYTTVRMVLTLDEENMRKVAVSPKGSNALAIKVPGGVSSITPPHVSHFSPDNRVTPEPPAYDKYSSSSERTYASSQVEQLKDELARKERQIKELKADIEFLRQQAPASSHSDLISEEVNKLKEQNHKLKQELANTKSRLALAADKLTSSGDLSAELEEAKKQALNLRTQLNEAIQKIRQLSQKQEEIITLKNRINELESQLQQTKLASSKDSEQVTQLKKRISELEVRLQQEKTASSKDSEQVAQMKNQLEEAKTSASENEVQLQKALSVIDALKQKLEDMNARAEKYASMQTDLQRANLRYERSRDELELAKEKIAELNSRITENIPSQSRINKLSEELEVSKNQLKTLNNQLTSSNEEIKRLKNEVSAYKEQVSDIEHAEAKIGELASKLALADERILNLQKDLEEKAGSKSELKELKDELKNRDHRLAMAQKEIEKNMKKVEEYDQLKAQHNNLQDELNKIKTAYQAVQQELSKAGNVAEIMKKVQTMKAELAETRTLLARSRERESEFISLKQRFEETNARLTEIAHENELLRKKTDLLNQKANILAKTIDTSTDEQVQILKNEVNSLSFKLEDAYDQNQKQINELKDQLSIASSVIINQSEELTKAHKIIEDLKTGVVAVAPQDVIVERSADSKKAIKLYEKAETFAKVNEINEAIKYLKEAIKKDPNYVRPYVRLGELYTQSGDLNSAMENLKIALLLDPDNNAAHHHLGNVYFALGNFNKAVEQFKLAIGINALTNFGSTLKNQGNLDAAIVTYKAAIELSPQDADLHYNLASAYKANNMHEKAIEEYNKALNLKPGFSNAHYNVAIVYAQIGQNNRAIQHFQEYLNLNPDATDADKIKNIILRLKS